MNPLNSFRHHMIDFEVHRDSNLLYTIKGLKNTEKGSNKKYIGFYPDADIQIGDVLSNPNSNIKYFVTDIDTSTYNGEIYQIKAYYQNTSPSSQSQSTIYNISNASNSIIGNQQQAILNNSSFNIDDLKKLIELYGEKDKEQLYELVELLRQSMENDNFHKGKLSKFSDLLAKHSWLPTSIAQILAAFIQMPH